MRRRITILLLAALCAASFSGCKGAPEAAPGSVLDFRLGEASLAEANGEVPFPLDGLLGIPEGENRPVVFLLHGAHGADDVTQSRYYQGFSYLVESLAKQGYLAVSININRAFSFEPFEGSEYGRAYGIFQAYYDLLRRANDGEAVFDADLTGKADLSKLNFIGHSRGGDDSLYIAKQLQDGGQDVVQSVLLVSSPLMITAEESAVDVPTGVVLSQYDGDVTGLETATLFNRAWFLDAERQTPVTMAFLLGGNHNQYNSAISQTDSLAPPQDVTYLPAETQRAFLTSYAAEFLNIFNHGGEAAALGNDAPGRLGFDFLPSVILPGGQRLLPDDAMTGITPGGMIAEAVTMSQIPAENTAAPFNHPGPLPENVSLYRLSWSQAGQSLAWDVAQGDWSDRQTLTLLLANDPTSSQNTDPASLSLSVTVTDGSGAAAAVTLDNKTALRHLPTQVVNLFAGMEDMPEYPMAASHTPLGTQLLPLEGFAGVDLSDIRTVTLTGESATGACMLGGFQVN